MANDSGKRLSRRVIDFITFVDLPIRKKFLVFFLGVLFWFLVLFTVSISTLTVIRGKSGAIVHQLIPQDRTAQTIVTTLQQVTYDSSELARTTNAASLHRLTEMSRARLSDVKGRLRVLKSGGQINNIDRHTGNLLEIIPVRPLGRDDEGERYITFLTEAVEKAEHALDEAASARLAALAGRAGSGRFDDRLKELTSILESAVARSQAFSATRAEAYERNSRDIGFDFLCTFTTIIAVLLTATGLLVVFTYWIARSIARPITSMIEQIRALGESDIKSARKIEITSNDEIGALTREFNGLMESISSVASFKKLIEEDNAIEDVYLRLAHKFKHDFGLETFTIYEISNSQNKMRSVYPIELPEATLYCDSAILEDCHLCRAKKTGHVVSSYEFRDMCRSFLPEYDKDYVCVPMIMGGATGGVAQFVFDRPPGDGNRLHDIERRLHRAKQYIQESVSVIDAKRLMNTLKDSALKDSLTGLYNRRFLQEYTETLVAGIMRREKQVGLIMCDLDYFKQVNDLYGHTTGDVVLKETSVLIRDSVRGSDLVIRFGGEEFLVVLLDIKEGDSTRIAEKIRENVQAAKIKVPDGIIQKTISLGISEFPRDTESFWQSIKFADVALYRAKETGRNRAIRFTSDMWKEEQF